MESHSQHYRALLKAELDKRIARNPSFSLRSFSKKVGIDPGQFSRVLSGKRNLTVQMASLIAHQVFTSPRERDYFIALVELSQKKNIKIHDRLLSKADRLKPKDLSPNIGLESLKFLSSWYYPALLELVETTQFSENSNRLAGMLGITPIQAKSGLETLQALGLIRKENGKWQRAESVFRTPTNVASAEIRTLNRQLIEKATEALEEQPIENRYIVGKTFAFSKKNQKKVQALVESFRHELSQYLIESSEPKDSVYQLNLQFFELTKTFKNKSQERRG